MVLGGSSLLLLAPPTTAPGTSGPSTTIPIPRPTSPFTVVTTIGDTIVQLPGGSAPSFWATWLAPLVTLGVGLVAAHLLRRTGKGTVRAAKDAATASQKAADTAAKAAIDLDRFRDDEAIMKTLYWAADHAIEPDSSRVMVGLKTLDALLVMAQKRQLILQAKASARTASKADGDSGEAPPAEVKGTTEENTGAYSEANDELIRATVTAVQSVAVPALLTVIATKTTRSDTGGSVHVDNYVKVAAEILDSVLGLIEESLKEDIRALATAILGRNVPVLNLELPLPKPELLPTEDLDQKGLDDEMHRTNPEVGVPEQMEPQVDHPERDTDPRPEEDCGAL